MRSCDGCEREREGKDKGKCTLRAWVGINELCNWYYPIGCLKVWEERDEEL